MCHWNVSLPSGASPWMAFCSGRRSKYNSFILFECLNNNKSMVKYNFHLYNFQLWFNHWNWNRCPIPQDLEYKTNQNRILSLLLEVTEKNYESKGENIRTLRRNKNTGKTNKQCLFVINRELGIVPSCLAKWLEELEISEETAICQLAAWPKLIWAQNVGLDSSLAFYGIWTFVGYCCGSLTHLTIMDSSHRY